MMVTLNMLACSRTGLIPTILKQCIGYFDKIRVLDGSVDGSVCKVCDRISKDIHNIAYVWGHDLSDSLNKLLYYAEVGEWFFYIADDELPSQQLLENIPDIIDHCERNDIPRVQIPFTVLWDGLCGEDMLRYIHQARAFNTMEKAREYGIDACDKFRLGRMFKIFDGIKFNGITHEGITDYNEKRYNIEYPIIHMKRTDDFILGNLWTSVINPEGQGLSGDSLVIFKKGLATSQFTGDENVIEIKLRSSDFSDGMKSWIDCYSNSKNAVEFSWFAVYYFKYHPELVIGWLDFIHDSRFHLWFEMTSTSYHDDELIIETVLHDDIKIKLMQLGFKTVGDYRQNIKDNK